MRRILQTVLLAALSLCCLSPSLRATDIQIFPTGPVFKISGLAWGTSTQPGFNNNYFFTPLNINESVCVYVKNNNPTNSHTFTASISITSDPSNTTPSDGTWQIGASSSAIFVGTSPGVTSGITAQVSGVAQVSVNFSASSVQAGSPDTANVSIIQTTGACFGGNNSITSYPQNVSAVPTIQSISDGLSQAFTAFTNVGASVINTDLLHVNVNSGARSIYFDKVVISTTATATIGIVQTTTTGTTCTAGTIANQKTSSTVTSTALTNSSCTVHPTATSGGFVVQLPANAVTVIDLRGIICPAGSTTGVDVFAFAATTAATNQTLVWYEK